MGACCGKSDRKSQGYVLGGSNTSSNASAPQPPRTGTSAGISAAAGKAVTSPQPNTTGGGGKTLGSAGAAAGGAPASPRAQGELSASALAAQKRAEAADKRGVQQGGGQLAKKLADKKKQSPFAVEEQLPETNTQWN